MDFDLTDEQRLLKDSVERLIADQYDVRAAQAVHGRAGRAGAARVWTQYAELGLLGLPFAEAARRLRRRRGRDHDRHGGVRPRPGAGTLFRHGDPGRRTAAPRRQRRAAAPRWCPQIAAGKLQLAFAHVERQSRYDLADVATTARSDGDG